MSKPFKTFIVILIISSIASSGAQETTTRAPQTGNPVQPSGTDGSSTSLASTDGSSSGTGGGVSGLIESIISIPATLLSFILSPIRALLSVVLGGVGNLVGSILNGVFSLVGTILSPIFSLIGIPVDIAEDAAGGVGGLVREILKIVFSDILGIGSSSTASSSSVTQASVTSASGSRGPIVVTPATLVTIGPRVRRDLVMDTIMDITSYVNSVIHSFLLNLSDSTQDAASDFIHWGWAWAKKALLPRVDQLLVEAKDSPWISTDMAQWFNDLHEMYAWLHMFGIV
ncbi:uncharacterized protein [Venturia canescens]|uniref:uncharacterized protein n=1 Tax=Venturia canescens TaxID=32260 RepID=UPI001C9C44BB|nr:uncharacterized protein LOC122419510 [Venturia canescens]